MHRIDNECYVSIETAKLLKQAGFYYKCRACFYVPNAEMEDQRPTTVNHSDNWNVVDILYSAPTLEIVQRWLREVHNIEVSVEWFVSLSGAAEGNWNLRKYNPVAQFENESAFNEDLNFDSYDVALEAGVNMAIKKFLIKNQD